MNQKIRTALTLSLLLGTSAQASTLFPTQTIFGQLQKDAVFSERTSSPVVCTDLTGTWKGTCEKDGKISPDELHLEQHQCLLLTDKKNGMSYAIGGNKSVMEVRPNGQGGFFVLQTNETYHWIKPSRLEVQFSATARVIDSPASNTITGTAYLEKNGDRLNSESNVMGKISTCAYSKY